MDVGLITGEFESKFLVLISLLHYSLILSSTSKLKILQIIMWNIGMAQKAKETRSGCLVHIVQ